jgi:hypothetical protein
MANPLYFFSTVTLDTLLPRGELNRGLLSRYDLDAVLGDVPAGQFSRTDFVKAIIEGTSGAMLCVNTAGQPPPRFGYFPDFQTWALVRNDPPLWIGVDREHPPTPEDLARPVRVSGHDVRLADGHTYHVPVIRSPARNTLLPQDMYRGPDGQFQTGIRPDYLPLWERSARVWDMIYGEEDETREMRYVEILDHCLAILGVNYRVGHAEQAALRLVSTQNDVWEALFAAAVDVPLIEEVLRAEKKTPGPSAPGPVSSTPGPPAAGPTTAPAGENSSSPDDTAAKTKPTTT